MYLMQMSLKETNRGRGVSGDWWGALKGGMSSPFLAFLGTAAALQNSYCGKEKECIHKGDTTEENEIMHVLL